jgi:multidrug efflux pump subunit AcrB
MISLVVSLTLIPMLSSLKAKAADGLRARGRASAMAAGEPRRQGRRGRRPCAKKAFGWACSPQLGRGAGRRGFAHTIGRWMAWLGERS